MTCWLLLDPREVLARASASDLSTTPPGKSCGKSSKSQRHSVILAANRVFHRTLVGSSRTLSLRVQKGSINRGMPLRHALGFELSSAFGAH